MPLDEGLFSFLDALLPLERAIYDNALMNALAAILPAKRDMHHAVEYPERFPAFRGSPQNGQAYAGDKTLNKVAALGIKFDVRKGNEVNAACIPIRIFAEDWAYIIQTIGLSPGTEEGGSTERDEERWSARVALLFRRQLAA